MSNYESLMILLALITLIIKIIELFNENKKESHKIFGKTDYFLVQNPEISFNRLLFSICSISFLITKIYNNNNTSNRYKNLHK